LEQLSRIQLYKWILSSENNIYRFIENKRIKTELIKYKDDFFNTVRFNFVMIRNIESYYASSISDEIKASFTKEKFKNLYQENLNSGLENLNDIMSQKHLETERQLYLTFIDEISDTANPYYMFNKLMNQLDKTSNRSLSLLYQDIEVNGKGESLYIEHKNSQVFLSYASEDRLYTLCLYIYMSSQGINLYVDWLFSDFKENGISIKHHLFQVLKNSDQFLFLQSLNSELQIKGSHNIKGWCSWEMGNYYSIKKREKYYIELYSRPDTKRKTERSLQLDGFKKVSKIENGRIHGI